MVGVPKTNRCEHCRRRKCDEDWPTCGTCRRAKRVCSGPSTSLKFVHNGHHTRESRGHGENNRIEYLNQAREPPGNTAMLLPDDYIEHDKKQEEREMLVQVRHHKAGQAGGTFAKLRPIRPTDLKPSMPGRIPRSSVDNVVAEVVHSLESTAGTELDLGISITWAGLVPKRLYSSPAFCAAIDLFINTWIKARQVAVLSPSSVLDRKAYGKALAYLRSALLDPDQAYDVGTLAATALIHKVEIDFDDRRCFSTPSSHSSGLYALMAARGPPKLNDELDIHLCFEIMGRLTMHMIMNEHDNFYKHENWMRTMQEALQSDVVHGSPFKDFYSLTLTLAQWPDLVMESRRFHLDPDAITAEHIAAKAAKMSEELLKFDIEKIWLLWETKAVWTVPNPQEPWGESYHFVDWSTSQILIMHASLSISLARIEAAALAHLGRHDALPLLEQQLLEWSQRIWKANGYVGQFRFTGSNMVASLTLSFESATGAAREAILDKARDLNPGFESHVLTEAVLMKACMIVTGRLPYPEPFSGLTGTPIVCHGHGEQQTGRTGVLSARSVRRGRDGVRELSYSERG